SATVHAPSLPRGSLCRQSSAIRTGCAKKRPSGSVRGVSREWYPYRDLKCPAGGCRVERRVLPVKQPIKYFSFWDVPRTFAFEQAGKVYVLTAEFDDGLDEYPDDYEVFVVSGIKLSAVSDWKVIEPLPKTRIGKVAVAAVQFDESHRKFVDSSFL